MLSVSVTGLRTAVRSERGGAAVFNTASTDVVARSDRRATQVAFVSRDGRAKSVAFKVVSRLGPVALAPMNGGISITDVATGDELSYVTPPWARNVDGEVATSYEVVGSDTFVQRIAAARGTVVADPSSRAAG